MNEKYEHLTLTSKPPPPDNSASTTQATKEGHSTVDPNVFQRFYLTHAACFALRVAPDDSVNIPHNSPSKPDAQDKESADSSAGNNETDHYDCYCKLTPMSIPSYTRRVLALGKAGSPTTYYSDRDHLVQLKGEDMSGIIMLLNDMQQNRPKEFQENSYAQGEYCQDRPKTKSKDLFDWLDWNFDSIVQHGENKACVRTLDGKENLMIVEWDWEKSLYGKEEKRGLLRMLNWRYFGRNYSPVTMVATVAPDRTIFWMPIFAKGERLKHEIEEIRNNNYLVAFWPTYLDGPNIWICKSKNWPWLPHI